MEDSSRIIPTTVFQGFLESLLNFKKNPQWNSARIFNGTSQLLDTLDKFLQKSTKKFYWRNLWMNTWRMALWNSRSNSQNFFFGNLLDEFLYKSQIKFHGGIPQEISEVMLDEIHVQISEPIREVFQLSRWEQIAEENLLRNFLD